MSDKAQASFAKSLKSFWVALKPSRDPKTPRAPKPKKRKREEDPDWGYGASYARASRQGYGSR